MAFTILKIRFHQLYRNFLDFGIYRFTFFLVFLATVLYVSFHIISNQNNNLVVLVFTGFGITTLHLSRKDKHFIRTITSKDYLIYWLEYLFLALPILSVWLFRLNWQAFATLFFLCLLIPLLLRRTSQYSTGYFLNLLINPLRAKNSLNINFRIPFINPLAFEWISGFRSTIIVLAPTYLIILGFSFKPIVAPVGAILLTLIISGFYFNGESREFIEIYANSAKQFLRRKITMAISHLLFFLSPIILINLIFQHTTWIYILASLIVSSGILIIAILIKYSLFAENTNLNKNSTIATITIIGLLIPILWPLPIIMSIIHYRKAKNKLTPYFNAKY